ncbi:SpoIIE family protein phosphatase [Streptomyces sp. SCUT-3]|nr:SpoIIE family protein phosphatase [Streptomyces sp. SCUT-3]
MSGRLRWARTPPAIPERSFAFSGRAEPSRSARRRSPIHPTSCPPAVAGVESARLYRPVGAARRGGDFLDLWPCGGGADGRRVRFTLGDSVGKGLQAAAAAEEASALVRREAGRGLPPGEVLGRLNTALAGASPSMDPVFCSALHGVAEIGEGPGCRLTVRLANAGHLPALVVRSDGRLERLYPTGPLAGILPGAEFGTAGSVLEEGDLLLCYTDGLLDAQCEGGRLGEGPVVAAARAHAGRPPEELVGALARTLSAPGVMACDDVAVLALRPAAA